MKSMLIEFIKKYAPVDDEQASVLADYALATWQPLPSEVKYLHITGGPGTGKSILGRVMKAICKDPLFAHAYVDTALLAALDAAHPATLIIESDEIAMAEIRNILSSGRQRSSGVIIRMVQDAPKHFVPVSYKIYGYKIVLGDWKFSDPVVESHCIRINLKPTDTIPAYDDFCLESGDIADYLAAQFEILGIMDDFDTELYGWGGMSDSLTDRQRLQLEIAGVLNTSVADAKHRVGSISTKGLRHALALAKHRELKTLTKMLEVEVRKRGFGNFIQEEKS